MPPTALPVRSIAAALVAMATTLVTVPSRAEPPAERPRPFAMTISGGVSLGAYEAGFLDYVTDLVRKNPDVYDLRAITGTSAGSINGLLMALDLCRPASADPRDTLLYRTWMSVGLKQLFVPEDTTATGLFSRRAFDAPVAALERAWNEGMDARCDLVFGAAVTRLTPRPLEARKGALVLPRVEERFVVRLRGRGAGRPPLVRHFVDPASQRTHALLPIDGDDARPFEALRDLLLASSAFPLAFAPVRLAHCLWDRSQGEPRCTRDGARVDDFVDGGVFDNQPLGLAVRIAETGLEAQPDGRLGWRNAPDESQRTMPPGFLLGYLDLDSRVYPLRTGEETAAPKSALGMAATFLSTFVEAARTKGLVSLFTDHPELGGHLVVAQGSMPLMSELLGAFFGFFEADFRQFDFYAGMYEAAHASEASELLAGATRGGRPPPRPEDGTRGDGATPRSPGWAPFHCLRDVMDRTGDPSRTCAGDELESFRILLQVTLARLHSHCRALAAEHAAPPPSGPCAEAMRGAPLVRVPHLPWIPEDRLVREPSEGEVDYVLRVLAEYHFHFRDLGLSPKRADQAPYAIRFALGDMLERFADVQPDVSTVLSLASRALNALRYVPPTHIVHVSLGYALEAGYSYTNPRAPWRWFRPAVSLSSEGFLSWSSTEPTYASVTPYLGAEVEPVGWNGATMQWRFGARGGYAFSSHDQFSTGPCDTSDPRPCSRLIAEAYGSVSLFELAVLRLGTFVSPPLRTGEGVYWGVRPSIGIEWAK